MFNPLAWWVVKNLDECAEWLCDDEAIGLGSDGAMVYADVLLRLGTNAGSARVPATAIRGGRLHKRIRRVLSRETAERSILKKLLLAAVPLALLAAHLVRVQLVAAGRDAADPAITSPGVAPARAQNARALPPPITNPEREERAYRKLANPTNNVEFIDVPLAAAVQYFSEFHDLPIRIDEDALKAATIPVDLPVTLKMDGVPFRRILDRFLLPLDLDWHVEGPGLLVTTRSAAGSRLDAFLKYELQIIDYFCEPTDSQTQKLQLAGRGDIQRLNDGIQERSAKIELVKNDEKRVSELLIEIEQLHQRVESGPFGKDSLFRKTLETLLTPEQTVKYKPIREVLQAGGQVATLQRGPDVFLTIRLSQTAFTDDDLSRLKELSILGSLDLTLTQVTDAGLVHLAKLTISTRSRMPAWFT